MARRAEALARQRRRARTTGMVGIVLAVVLPVWLFHGVVADIASSGASGTIAVVGWAPWVLMALGVLCAVPVALHELRDRDRRFYSQGTAAWSGWGVTLYLLGFLLATQVAQIHGLHS
jgi:hypothetical protein